MQVNLAEKQISLSKYNLHSVHAPKFCEYLPIFSSFILLIDKSHTKRLKHQDKMKVEELMEVDQNDKSSTKNTHSSLQYIKRDLCSLCYGLAYLCYGLSILSVKITTFLENLFYRYLHTGFPNKAPSLKKKQSGNFFRKPWRLLNIIFLPPKLIFKDGEN